MISKDKIKQDRDKRKEEKKIKKLKGAVRTMKKLEQYKEVLGNPLFDEGMKNTILKRMENKTALNNQWDREAKKIIKLIVEHPLITSDDLIFIKSIKSKPGRYAAESSYYNSSHLNSAIANKGDAPKSAIISLVKIPQFDLKIKALRRKDLDTKEIDMIINYAVKQHGHMPAQIKEILQAANKTKLLTNDKFKKEIIDHLKKKYKKGSNWRSKPTGIKFFETLLEYGWFGELTEVDKKEMFEVVIEAYKQKRLKKERIFKIVKLMDSLAGEFLLNIYNETKDESFFPDKVVDVFLF